MVLTTLEVSQGAQYEIWILKVHPDKVTSGGMVGVKDNYTRW